MSDLLSELRDAVTVDFESAPITPRPQYPPEPVGVAIKIGAQPSRYYAWAHPAQNNTTRERALAALTKVWTGRRPLLMHHAKFDLAVGIEKLGLPMPTVPIHDTMPQLFLRDPRAVTFALKPSAHAILGLAPEERDAVEDWLMEHQPIPGVKISRAPKSPHYVGAYIGSAPGNLVATYACGDTDRTYGLAQVLGQHLATTGMVAAYAREQALLPTIMGMERFGVRVDLPRLLVDCERTERVIATVDAWIFHHLKSTPFNLDAKGELVQALLAGGAATAASLGSTKTGKIATNKAALAQGVTDPPLMAMLRYRGALCHSLRTYMRPWVETAQQSGGRIFTTWHSTRSDESGARTGRFSSTPNFQNCVKVVPDVFARGDSAFIAPMPRGLKLPPLPYVRSYIVPEPGHVLIDRDYASQELRILAHFEDGAMLRAYRDDQWIDVHEHARISLSARVGREFKRGEIKTISFGMIYGLGVTGLARKLGVSMDEARQAKDAYLATFPGLRELYQVMRDRAKVRAPITTWGGRQYYCEQAKEVDGRARTMDYKLVNVLIQGSAADCTKEAIRRYAAVKPADHHPLLLVHDEVVVSVPADECAAGMELLRQSMESVQFDVPMLSEGKWSQKNWGSLEDYDAKGQRIELEAA